MCLLIRFLIFHFQFHKLIQTYLLHYFGNFGVKFVVIDGGRVYSPTLLRGSEYVVFFKHQPVSICPRPADDPCFFRVVWWLGGPTEVVAWGLLPELKSTSFQASFSKMRYIELSSKKCHRGLFTPLWHRGLRK